MYSIFSEAPYSLIPILAGGLLILVAVFQRPVMRFLRMRPPSELYTLPRLQRSARITEFMSRIMVILFGVFAILQGAGPRLLTPDAVYALSVALIALVGLLLLGVFAVTLVHWKA
jgi:hypothetical protein